MCYLCISNKLKIYFIFIVADGSSDEQDGVVETTKGANLVAALLTTPLP